MPVQAKKANATGKADIACRNRPADDQLQKLCASGIGYYIYYYANEIPANFPPVVQAAHEIKNSGFSLRSVDTFYRSVDFATFIIDAIIKGMGGISSYDTMNSAIRAMRIDNEIPGIIIGMSVGKQTCRVLSDEFKHAISNNINGDDSGSGDSSRN